MTFEVIPFFMLSYRIPFHRKNEVSPGRTYAPRASLSDDAISQPFLSIV